MPRTKKVKDSKVEEIFDDSPKETITKVESQKVELELGKLYKFVIVSPKSFKDQEHFDEKYADVNHFVIVNKDYEVSALTHYKPNIYDLMSRDEFIAPIDLEKENVTIKDFKVVNKVLTFQRNSAMMELEAQPKVDSELKTSI